MKKQLRVIIVILIIQLILFSLVGVYIWYTFIIDDIKEPIGSENSFRYGPVILKFDDEWVMTDGTQRFIRVAFDKLDIDEDDLRYENMCPESLAINTSTALIVEWLFEKDIEVQYFDIPVESNEIWLDLYIMISHIVTDAESKLGTYYTNWSGIYNSRNFYFYHPTDNKWLGTPYGNSLEIWHMDESIYDHNFRNLKEFKNYIEICERKRECDSGFAAEILDKRVFKIPSSKELKDNNGVFEDSRMFEWYEETTEEELKKAASAADEADDEFADDYDAESDE